MKTVCAAIVLVSCVGCVSTHCHQPMVQGGMPIMGSTASTASTTSTVSEATPALGMGWETVSFRIPKPRLFAVPKPQAGPQVVGVPLLMGGPAMTMGVGAPMAAPMMAAPMAAAPTSAPQAAPQGNPTPQGEVSPQSTGCNSCNPPCSTGCQDGCTEGCNSQAMIEQECQSLMQDISCLQQELSIQTKNASIHSRH